jgi:hypothetical protein
MAPKSRQGKWPCEDCKRIGGKGSRRKLEHWQDFYITEDDNTEVHLCHPHFLQRIGLHPWQLREKGS